MICLFCSNRAMGQNDTVSYYCDYNSKLVSTRDSADFFFTVTLQDSSIDNRMYRVKAYYMNGKIRLIGSSRTNNFKRILYQGPLISFYPNGNKMVVMNFVDGWPVGSLTSYYPNGKLYNVKMIIRRDKWFYKQCNDSTGKVLAINGNGTWIDYFDNGFKDIYIEGAVSNGLREGEWQGKINNFDFKWIFKKGNAHAVKEVNNNLEQSNLPLFKPVDIPPEFHGELNNFTEFLAKNMHYPAEAKRKGTQGQVIVNFVVGKNGELSNIKVAKGIGDGCDEEAIRLVKLSSPWTPAMRNHKKVSVGYNVPVEFN